MHHKDKAVDTPELIVPSFQEWQYFKGDEIMWNKRFQIILKIVWLVSHITGMDC